MPRHPGFFASAAKATDQPLPLLFRVGKTIRRRWILGAWPDFGAGWPPAAPQAIEVVAQHVQRRRPAMASIPPFKPPRVDNRAMPAPALDERVEASAGDIAKGLVAMVRAHVGAPAVPGCGWNIIRTLLGNAYSSRQPARSFNRQLVALPDLHRERSRGVDRRSSPCVVGQPARWDVGRCPPRPGGAALAARLPRVRDQRDRDSRPRPPLRRRGAATSALAPRKERFFPRLARPLFVSLLMHRNSPGAHPDGEGHSRDAI